MTPSTASTAITEEHELPSLEAVLAGTLALMTGHSQSMQAELGPCQRLGMGLKIDDNLALLTAHPLLSPGFQQVLFGLRRRWQAMNECTEQAACACSGRNAPAEATARFLVEGPRRLQ